MSKNLEVVKSLWSNVPWSNETVVIGDPIMNSLKFAQGTEAGVKQIMINMPGLGSQCS